VKDIIEKAKKTCADTVPENRYGPFLPFSGMTFKRHGNVSATVQNGRTIMLSKDGLNL